MESTAKSTETGEAELSPPSGGTALYGTLSTEEQEKILHLQHGLLEAVARGGDTRAIVDQVCTIAERLLPNAVGSVMLLDPTGEHLSVYAAPHIPPEGIERLGGLRPGPGGGSCGNAVFRGSPQFVRDTFTDPRWNDLRQFAYDFNLCSCWSMPILSAEGAVIGSFALSSFEHRSPSAFHRKLLEISAWIVGIVLERAKAREMLRLHEKAFDGAEEGILIVDAEERIVSLNRAVTRLLGFEASEIVGKTPRLFSSGRHDPAFYRAMWDEIAGIGHWSGEIWNRRKDGTVIPEWLSISAVKDETGAVSHYVGIFSDISERIAATEAMREKTEMLVQSNADLEQFAYVASHDLQTPLRNVMNYTQLLDRNYRGKLDADADEFLSLIVDGSKRMMGLITDLLEYSRVANQTRPLSPIAVSDAVTQAIANLKRDIDETDPDIHIGPLPVVLAERSLLVSLFQNLIGNSLKYRSPDRRLRIAVEAGRTPAGNWRITVSDNGIGIAAEYHEKIFEIFQRLDPGAEKEGTGIGLTLCRRITHHFGGSIAIDSAAGRGTTMILTLRDGDLPLIAAEPPGTPSAPPAG